MEVATAVAEAEAEEVKLEAVVEVVSAQAAVDMEVQLHAFLPSAAERERMPHRRVAERRFTALR